MLASFIEYLKKGKFPGQKFKKPPYKPIREEVQEVLAQIQREMEQKKNTQPET